MAQRRTKVLHPGWVTSKTDGTRHFIEFRVLVDLYRFDPRDCINANSDNWARPWERGQNRGEPWRHYWPRADGDYSVPGELIS